MDTIEINEHPLLDAIAFVSRFPQTLQELPSPGSLRDFFQLEANAPLERSAESKKAVRDLLRWGGYKPSGRNKPASEYLITAVEKGWLNPEAGINIAVDIVNAVSLHSALPISVLDADLLESPLRISVCEEKIDYIFNPSGQTLSLSGLLCLFDSEGPCGSPVKDSQRTKTHEETRRTLTIIWGTKDLPHRSAATLDWYLKLLEPTGAQTEIICGAP